MSTSSWSAAASRTERRWTSSTIEIDAARTGSATRLERNPKAFRIPCNDLDIFIVRDFLDERDCAELIALIDADREPSKLLSPTDDPEFWVNYTSTA